jgi:hypothetical protein
MNNPLETIEELKKLAANKKQLKIFESLSNHYARMDNKEKGYEPKCKVCNHKDKEEIERLHELGYRNRNIIRKLDLAGDFSEQALGRHLNKHYPVSRKYYNKIRLIEENHIKEAIKTHPPIANYLLDNNSKYADIFLNGYGFCSFGNVFCGLIPKKTVSDNYEVMEYLKKEFTAIKDGYSFYKENSIINIMVRLNKCYSCQLSMMPKYYNKILETIFEKVFDKDLDIEKDILPYINKEFDEKDMIK